MMFDCYRGWEIEIRNFCQRFTLELEDSPSLKNYIQEILLKSYKIALENMIDSYLEPDFPVV